MRYRTRYVSMMIRKGNLSLKKRASMVVKRVDPDRWRRGENMFAVRRACLPLLLKIVLVFIEWYPLRVVLRCLFS